MSFLPYGLTYNLSSHILEPAPVCCKSDVAKSYGHPLPCAPTSDLSLAVDYYKIEGTYGMTSTSQIGTSKIIMSPSRLIFYYYPHLSSVCQIDVARTYAHPLPSVPSSDLSFGVNSQN